jgi:hypothetical protein
MFQDSEEYIAPIFRVKSKPSKKPADSGGKLVKDIVTNIRLNRKARRLECNTDEHVGKGGWKLFMGTLSVVLV